MDAESLRGKLLIAGPNLFDPNFRRTILLIGEHNEEGALGVVLNRPTPATVRDVVPPLAELAGGDELLFWAVRSSRSRPSCWPSSRTPTPPICWCSTRSASAWER